MTEFNNNTSKSLAVVTGGSRGIGKALCLSLANQGVDVLAIGRDKSKLEEMQACAPDAIRYCVADLSHTEQWGKVVESVGDDKVSYLIHNAAKLGAVCEMNNLELQEWREVFTLNTEAPLFLTQLLLPQFTQSARVLFVTSGAASYPLSGFGAYCCSKAAMDMVKKTLAADLEHQSIALSSILPGMVDTNMQQEIRNQDSQRFPVVELFKEAQSSGQLLTSEIVADFMTWLLTRVDTTTFKSTDWDITNKEQLAYWEAQAQQA
ncbi:SDR family NAD(P)-dependent oxidoreductase [Agarilytica rhodophyticola]|uniref:SDR family NAD(P)-dependent oxidoreductase n=1 Tax=Agarilytica rhodophyticola TaxID=1737490 RepID=UPI000B34808A|nr:SDR family NAD(P)-dependent oxidoreductase [Agarilytica rhodophyticola]